MKSLEFIYQDTKIHFLLQHEGQVMVNATEMAKAFGKRLDFFLKTDHAKAFIDVLKFTPYGGNFNILDPEKDIVFSKGRAGTYFHRILALKFAAWLDPQFELWVYSHIEEVLFKKYRKHLGAITERKDLLNDRREIDTEIFELKKSLKEEDEKYKRLQELQNQRKTLSTRLNSSDHDLIKEPELFTE